MSLKWITKHKYVDLETGEIIPGSKLPEGYYIVKKLNQETKFKQNEYDTGVTTATKTITNGVRRLQLQKLF